jgi:hypothetical protein
LLFAFSPNQTLSSFRALKLPKVSSQTSATPEALRSGVPRTIPVGLARPFREIVFPFFSQSMNALLALASILYRSYRRLPVAVRVEANRYLFSELRRSLQVFAHLYSPISPRRMERDAHGLSHTRYQSGLAKIFGTHRPPFEATPKQQPSISEHRETS